LRRDAAWFNMQMAAGGAFMATGDNVGTAMAGWPPLHLGDFVPGWSTFRAWGSFSQNCF